MNKNCWKFFPQSYFHNPTIFSTPYNILYSTHANPRVDDECDTVRLIGNRVFENSKNNSSAVSPAKEAGLRLIVQAKGVSCEPHFYVLRFCKNNL